MYLNVTFNCFHNLINTLSTYTFFVHTETFKYQILQHRNCFHVCKNTQFASLKWLSRLPLLCLALNATLTLNCIQVIRF